jgi:hypothetical protein
LPGESEYLTKGGESKIYLAPDRLNVIKVNDTIYYATWDEYLNSLLLHNLLFPNFKWYLSIVGGKIWPQMQSLRNCGGFESS